MTSGKFNGPAGARGVEIQRGSGLWTMTQGQAAQALGMDLDSDTGESSDNDKFGGVKRESTAKRDVRLE